MNHQLWHHMSLISELHSAYAEDPSDQLMSKFTSLGLLAVASVLAVKQYIFKPIQCWVPAEWPRPWEVYTESFCWIQNTYHVAYMAAGHPALHAREENEISYFQWVPILLPLQALLALLPHAFWRFASAQSACDPNGVVKLAIEMEEGALSPKKRHKLLTYTSGRLHKAIGIARSLGGGPCSKPRPGCYLFIVYIISKLVHLLIGLGHLYLMKVYLGFDNLNFGWTCASDLLAGRQWEQTRIFPRVTFCDVPVKQLGQWNVRSVQCVLPTNMLYEKIYIFLWFWIVLCMFLMTAFSVHWILTLAIPGQRTAFIRRLMRITQRPAGIDKAVAQFDASLLHYLRIDGVFVLNMVASRCGELSAAEILDGIVQIHRRDLPINHRNLPDSAPFTFPDKATLPLKSRESPHAVS